MAGPHPAVAAVRSAVVAATADLPDGSLVLVACSGGPDSLALAAGLAFVAERSARTAPRGGLGPVLRGGAVVVDHGMQEGSAAVAAQAARTCTALGLEPVEVRTVAVGGPGGPEGAAREARYAALADVAGRLGAVAVLVGHTCDDQAESVLLGLARGSGARSLAGMAARRGLWRRPLLGLGRADTVAACAALGLEVWADPTNDAPPERGTAGVPLRSRVRSRVLPVLERELGPGVGAALARTADLLRDDADALDALAEGLLAEAARVATEGVTQPSRATRSASTQPAGDPGSGAVVRLDVATLAQALPAIRRRTLRAAALVVGSPAGALTRTHTLALDALVTDWHGQGPVTLPGRVVGSRACGTLEVRAERTGAPHGDPPVARGSSHVLPGPPAGGHTERGELLR